MKFLIVTSMSCFLLLLGCVSNKENQLPKNEIISNNTPYNLEGDWKLIYTEIVSDISFVAPTYDPEIPAPAYESGPFEFLDLYDLKFTKDSVFLIEYPIKIHEKVSYSQDTNFLRYNNELMPILLENDTLYLYLEDYEGVYLKEAYARHNFNEDAINLLLKDEINFNLLTGKWFLKREYSYDYGITYWLNYPHELEDSISFNSSDILISEKNEHSLMIKTDGILKKYYIDYNDNYLILRPAEWFKGEDPYIHYDRVISDY